MNVPLPPLALRSIVAASEEDIFLWTGEADLACLLGLFEKHVQNRSAKPRVLDFGCGCGRLTRHLSGDSRYESFACDLNPDHVAWSRENIPGVQTVANGPTPPLPFENTSIDFTYLLSVFTHLPEAAAMTWLADLARIIRPGGIVAVTTHGYPAIEIIINSAVHHQMFGLEASSATKIRNELSDRGYIYYSLRPEVQKLANVGIDYGHSFIHPEHVRNYWSQYFDVVDHLPGGLRGWHDIIIMRAKGV